MNPWWDAVLFALCSPLILYWPVGNRALRLRGRILKRHFINTGLPLGYEAVRKGRGSQTLLFKDQNREGPSWPPAHTLAPLEAPFHSRPRRWWWYKHSDST